LIPGNDGWQEQRLLKRAVKISLEAQVIPLAIDAALELAGLEPVVPAETLETVLARFID
jgi:hypothetical protein